MATRLRPCQVSAVETAGAQKTLPRSLAFSSSSPTLTLQQKQRRGSLRRRCLPPTRATLTFERNSEH